MMIYARRSTNMNALLVPKQMKTENGGAFEIGSELFPSQFYYVCKERQTFLVYT